MTKGREGRRKGRKRGGEEGEREGGRMMIRSPHPLIKILDPPLADLNHLNQFYIILTNAHSCMPV